MLSLGRASVERNLCCSVLADSEIFRRSGGGCVTELTSGSVVLLTEVVMVWRLLVLAVVLVLVLVLV